jgi:hypothetical protein
MALTKIWKKCRNEGRETDNERMEKERLLSFGMLRRAVRWQYRLPDKNCSPLIRSGGYFENPNRKISRPEPKKKSEI